jgi:hypothetical protein
LGVRLSTWRIGTVRRSIDRSWILRSPRELLALARGVAHRSERRFAPLAAYLIGVAVGRLDGSENESKSYIRQLWIELEDDENNVM